jgi:hypothetical protein
VIILIGCLAVRSTDIGIYLFILGPDFHIEGMSAVISLCQNKILINKFRYEASVIDLKKDFYYPVLSNIAEEL